jgi:hypothetical protein
MGIMKSWQAIAFAPIALVVPLTILSTTPANSTPSLQHHTEMGMSGILGRIQSASVPQSTIQRTIAQVEVDLYRAKNLARQAAEEENGGLSRYWAEPAMHGPVSEAPYVDNGDGSWTFTFLGGPPGLATYTTESVVTVHTSGQVVIDYNGPIRDANSN